MSGRGERKRGLWTEHDPARGLRRAHRRPTPDGPARGDPRRPVWLAESVYCVQVLDMRQVSMPNSRYSGQKPVAAVNSRTAAIT